MGFKDYYKILGVARNAGREEIRKAFRKLARMYHPDVAEDKASAEQRFKEINEAYAVLSDPEKRRQYDRSGTQGTRGAEGAWREAGFRGRRRRRGRYTYQPRGYRTSGSGEGESDFGSGAGWGSDFLDEFFRARGFGGDWGRGGSGGSGQRRRQRPRSARGQDSEVALTITPDEAAAGVVRSITVEKGAVPGKPACRETYQVKIPPNVSDGQRLRVTGKGESGVGSGPAGDLYIRIRLVRTAEDYMEDERRYHDVNIAPWEAALGTILSVPSPQGPVQVRIPPGTESGSRFRMRGHGVRSPEGSAGDLYVRVHIKMPRELTKRERELWEQLARESPFDPRPGSTAR